VPAILATDRILTATMFRIYYLWFCDLSKCSHLYHG